MRRIGILGGTFNPVHFAHLIVAEEAYEQCALDQILFLPCKKPAYKNTREILPDALRYRMLELAIHGNPHFALSDLELQREGITYTADTMLEFKRLEPETEFYFIIGGDSLMNFDAWSRPEVILKNAHILATSRGNAQKAEIACKVQELNQKYQSDIRLFDSPAMEISSSEIRKRICAGRSVRYFLPEAVEDFIVKQLLYKEGTL